MVYEPRTLTKDEIEHFISRGYVVIRDAMPRDFVARQVDRMWTRLGYDRSDRSTWARERIHMELRDRWTVSQLAPRVWGAVLDLVGGEERIEMPYTWGDGFIVNLGVRADEPWEGPSRKSPGWHKDGDFFRHFLDSPEQGLLTLVLWTDVRSKGGATFIAPESVGAIARLLSQHPEGLSPEELHECYEEVLSQCNEFVEATGNAGDVYLLHPYMLHATAPNILRDGRAITNPPITLREPMRFDRPAQWLSPVEAAVLRGLDVDRLEFQPTGSRGAALPESRRERLEEHARERDGQEERLVAAGLPLHVEFA